VRPDSNPGCIPAASIFQQANCSVYSAQNIVNLGAHQLPDAAHLIPVNVLQATNLQKSGNRDSRNNQPLTAKYQSLPGVEGSPTGPQFFLRN
jgi:hypothetical protein